MKLFAIVMNIILLVISLLVVSGQLLTPDDTYFAAILFVYSLFIMAGVVNLRYINGS
jgi:uncharacterized membrane protein